MGLRKDGQKPCRKVNDLVITVVIKADLVVITVGR